MARSSEKLDGTYGVAGGGVPILGHLPAMGRDTLGFLESLSQYGDLVELRFGPVRSYVPTSPEIFNQILQHDSLYDKGGALYESARGMFGEGIVSCPHSQHRRHRRQLQPAFRREIQPHYASVADQEIEKLIQGWEAGSSIDVFAQMYEYALKTVVHAVLGIHIDEHEVIRIRTALEAVMSGVVLQTFMPKMMTGPRMPWTRKFNSALASLHEQVAQLIARARIEGAPESGLAVLDRSEHDWTEQELHDHVVSMIHAGSETTAMVLTWALYRVALHSDVQENIREELRTSTATSSIELVRDLTFTTSMFFEVLRLYPPAWAFTRTLTQDLDIRGHTLKAGSTLVCCSLTLHAREDLFDRPGEFDPARWLGMDTGKDFLRLNMTTFGGGARKCIGDTFAINESVLAIARIADRVTLAIDPQSNLQYQSGTIGYFPKKLLLKVLPTTPDLRR